MGSTLADGVSQGGAGPDEFRTAPLWGAGQRLFFLHDGRTPNIVTAVLKGHTSPANICTTVTATSETFTLNGQAITIPAVTTQTCGSESNLVVQKFQQGLTCQGQQDVINFLRSL